MKKAEADAVRVKALEMLKKANITVREDEEVEVADFGLGDIYNTGLEIVTYVNTDRCCAKELVLLPRQTCPEHRHAPIEEKNYPGKEETFRCRWGEVYLYVEGVFTSDIKAVVPEGEYTVFHEIILCPGEQYTLYPNTRHWFQAGKDGAVVSEFSTSSYDECDIFTDDRIIRIPCEE